METGNCIGTSTSEYRIGDTVVLGSEERFTYMGLRWDTLYKRTVYVYRPVNGKTELITSATEDEAKRLHIPSNFVVLLSKAAVPKDSINAPERKQSFTSKLFGWFLESNRWKHFLYAIPAGAINFWLAIGLALGMEFKDAQHGGRFDWADATCTAAGGFVGAALSRWLLGDYVLHYLIKLIF